MSMHNIEKKGASQASIWTAMIAVYLVWGSTYLAIRYAVATMPPFLMVAIRFLVAGGILFLFRRARGDQAPTRVEWRSAAIIGFLLLVGGNGGVVWAEQRVDSGITALMVGAVPLWIALLELLRLGKNGNHNRPSLLAILGVLVGFVGIAMLVGPVGLSGSTVIIDPLGALVLLLAAFSWAVGSLYSRGAHLPASPLLGTGMEMLAGGVGSLALSALFGEWRYVHLPSISATSITGLIYLIIFGSLVGFAAYTWLLRNAPTTLVSTYAYVNPVVAIFLGSLIAKEPVTPRMLVAAAIILGAVAIITMKPGVKKEENRKIKGEDRQSAVPGD